MKQRVRGCEEKSPKKHTHLRRVCDVVEENLAGLAHSLVGGDGEDLCRRGEVDRSHGRLCVQLEQLSTCSDRTAARVSDSPSSHLVHAD